MATWSSSPVAIHTPVKSGCPQGIFCLHEKVRSENGVRTGNEAFVCLCLLLHVHTHRHARFRSGLILDVIAVGTILKCLAVVEALLRSAPANGRELRTQFEDLTPKQMPPNLEFSYFNMDLNFISKTKPSLLELLGDVRSVGQYQATQIFKDSLTSTNKNRLWICFVFCEEKPR